MALRARMMFGVPAIAGLLVVMLVDAAPAQDPMQRDLDFKLSLTRNGAHPDRSLSSELRDDSAESLAACYHNWGRANCLSRRPSAISAARPSTSK